MKTNICIAAKSMVESAGINGSSENDGRSYSALAQVSLDAGLTEAWIVS